jgi:ATP-dependent DNA helicase HFM1/MER3
LVTNSPEINQVELPVQLEDKHLQELIYKYNLAYHHAGLSSNDREIVETLFKQNRIRVLCSTSTLAIGVNLPAHLVIIKSTLQYTSETGYTEYSELDLRQMIGRAGRAGYDSQGIAVIITSTETEYLYKTISEGKLEIDSKLLFGFIEFLNIEISNGNINSFSEAMKWLSFTFLHTRMKQNPSKYSLKPSEPIDQQIKSN